MIDTEAMAAEALNRVILFVRGCAYDHHRAIERRAAYMKRASDIRHGLHGLTLELTYRPKPRRMPSLSERQAVAARINNMERDMVL